MVCDHYCCAREKDSARVDFLYCPALTGRSTMISCHDAWAGAANGPNPVKLLRLYDVESCQYVG